MRTYFSYYSWIVSLATSGTMSGFLFLILVMAFSSYLSSSGDIKGGLYKMWLWQQESAHPRTIPCIKHWKKPYHEHILNIFWFSSLSHPLRLLYLQNYLWFPYPTSSYKRRERTTSWLCRLIKYPWHCSDSGRADFQSHQSITLPWRSVCGSERQNTTCITWYKPPCQDDERSHKGP